MKKHILISFMISLQTFLFAQGDPAYPALSEAPQVKSVEYYFNIDPGFGNGIEIAITPDLEISDISASIDVSSLSIGGHTIYIRSQDENNNWSHTAQLNFIIDHNPNYPIANPRPDIIYAEYFFNTDPGLGSGKSIVITSGIEVQDVEFNADILGLSVGAHRIFLRTQDSGGNWSMTHLSNFIIDADPEYPDSPLNPADIVAAEYFINTDPGYGQANPIMITPNTEISDIDINVNTSNLSNGIHNVYIRTQNENGHWSHTSRRIFIVGDEAVWQTDNQWRNGIEPNADRNVIIQGNLNVGIDYTDFEAKNLIVDQTGSIIISDQNSISVHGMIINNASAEKFIVASGGNLIQTDNSSENTGNIIVQRESQPMIRLDYTLWSSPVIEQNLFGFSPHTVNGVTNHPGSTGRIYIYDGENAYINPYPFNIDAVMEKGVGYMYRAPNNWTTDQPLAYSGVFTGIPFNGTLNIPTHSGNYTSVGNPYPSNLSADYFMSLNPDVSTLYFWNNNYSAGNNYASCTRGIGCIAANGGGNIPNGIISVGQGFIVQTQGNAVLFNNEMRVSDSGLFFKNNDSEKHRFWLNLSDSQNENYNQILIGYVNNATNDIDHQIDGKLFGYNGSAIYTLINDEQFTIQGRALPFRSSDVVKLGFRAINTAKYSISLSDFDGIFSDEMKIYLNDKQLNIIHNLMEADYIFESNAGEFHERFEIVYETDEVMEVNDPNLNSIEIYTHNDYIIINSKSEKILSAEVFDLDGRNIHKNVSINLNKYRIKSNSKGVLLLKIQTLDGKISTTKIINK